jgi:hypothetical protein
MTGLALFVVVPPLVVSIAVGCLAQFVWKPAYESGEWLRYDGDIGSDVFFRFAERNFTPCPQEEVGDADLVYQFADDRGGTFLRCQHSLADEPVRVALLGDSHAEHLFLGLAEAFPKTNIAYYMLPAAAADDLASVPSIETVVVSQWWNYRGVDEPYWREVLQRLTSAGKQVVLLGPTPDFSFPPEQCRNRVAPLIGTGRCSQQGSTVYQDSPDGGAEALRRVASGIEGARFVDVGRYFCDGDTCSMNQGDSLHFRDKSHLNINGSRYLADKLAKIPELSEARTQ